MSDPNNSNVTIVVQTLGKRAPEVPPKTLPSPPIMIEPEKPRRKRLRAVKYIAVFLIVAVLGIGTFVVVRAKSLTDRIFVGNKTTFIQTFQELLRGSQGSIRLEGEDLGQVNILLLGIGGEGHDGPYLSDTIILAQIRPDLKSVAMTSIPRDYLVNLDKYGYRKINAAFAEGYYKNKDFNEAGKMARETVEKISGLPIPYFAVIDFSGFQQAIDKVGGLDITIDRTFTDYSYPDNKNGYLPPQTFKQGSEHMDGNRALIFSRSRHAAGVEGSDFSRSQRQQKVIQAFKEKVISVNLISNPNSINELAEVFANHFHTNISPGEIYRLFQFSKDFGRDNIFTTSLDPKTQLTCPKILEETGAYVLVPCPGKTDKDIATFFKNAFTVGKVSQEQPVVWIAASNEYSQGYKDITKSLANAGITPIFLKSTDIRTETTIFQVNPKPATVDYLKMTYSINEISQLPADFKVTKEKVDTVILLKQSKQDINYVPPKTQKKEVEIQEPVTTNPAVKINNTTTPKTSAPDLNNID